MGNVARTIRLPIRETSLAGHCAVTGRAFLVPDAYGDLSAIDPQLTFDRSWDRVNSFRTRDVMCAAATFKGKLMGVAQVINSRGRPFGPDDLEQLQTTARLIGYALYHACLYNDLATMKQLDKDKAQFMRVMVHELKSPVAGAKMLMSLLTGQTFDNPQLNSLPQRISDRLDQMGDLIGDILVLAKVKSGEPLGEVAVLDLGAQTAAACDDYRPQAHAKGLTMTVDLPPAPVPVRIDVQGCALVLSNLVSNAVKYTPAGQVGVTLRARDGSAVLSVSDSGIGIPEKDVPKLFKEFFRASNAKRSDIKGSGVGLSGVKSIVERFGGELSLTTAEDAGSTFTVRLPLSDA